MRISDFWSDLRNALLEARCMSPQDASIMIETRFDKYADLWPRIEVSAATNLYYRDMIERAFAVRYMLSELRVLAHAMPGN
jgi:hypothetical protein